MINYQITIKSNAGTNTVTVTGELPDGEHVITGHDDGELASLDIVRKNELGHPVLRATRPLTELEGRLHTDIPVIPAGNDHFA